MLPAESRKTHVLPVRAFGDCSENVFADRICRTNTFLFYLFFWLLSRKYPKEICPCDDFEPKADLRDYSIAPAPGGEDGADLRGCGIPSGTMQRGVRTFGVTASSPAPGEGDSADLRGCGIPSGTMQRGVRTFGVTASPRFRVKRAVRTFGTAASPRLGAGGRADLWDRGIVSGSGWRGRRGLRKHRAAPDDRGHNPPGQCDMSASLRKECGMLCVQASESGKGSCVPQSGGAQKKRRHSGFKSAWAAQGRANLRGKDGLRCTRLSDLRTVCGAGHRAAACPSGAAAGRLCREARCRRGALPQRRVAAEALHGMGKARAAPAYFPKKREIRRRLRRRTMYKRSSFDTAMSYSRKAALASR